MTTIVFKDDIMAADGQRIYGSHIFSLTENKLVHNTEWLGGLAGAGTTQHELEKIIFCPEQPEYKKGVDYDALRYNGRDLFHTSSQMYSWFKVHQPYAIGSGSDYAFGALAAGKTAIEAVKIAIKYDLYSGGSITAFRYNRIARGFERIK